MQVSHLARALTATAAIVVLAAMDLAAHGLQSDDAALALLGLLPVGAFALYALAPTS